MKNFQTQMIHLKINNADETRRKIYRISIIRFPFLQGDASFKDSVSVSVGSDGLNGGFKKEIGIQPLKILDFLGLGDESSESKKIGLKINGNCINCLISFTTNITTLYRAQFWCRWAWVKTEIIIRQKRRRYWNVP